MQDDKVCFVITGFGPKSDPDSGRIIDLDKTFENLIKPVFDELGYRCFRAKEIRHTGIIDIPMYEWIYKADIVVADVSTLNPNALYELGVRHALRPSTTIVISEDQTKYPFDINHTLITKYEHLGKDIGVSEAKRFKSELLKIVKSVVAEKKNDSPVYSYLPKLTPPTFSNKELEIINNQPKNQVSLSELVSSAEDAKNKKDFNAAIELYKVCLKFEPNNEFLVQRLALVTYKHEKPNLRKALVNAENILKQLNPEETTDVETLGLSGAINKRLYEVTTKLKYLNKSIGLYSKGFNIAKDYYNGINYADLLTLKSTLVDDLNQSLYFYQHGIQIRNEVIEICYNHIKDKSFEDRNDKEWIFQSLAQAALGLDNQALFDETIAKIKKHSKGDFDLDTFFEHNVKVKKYVQKNKEKRKAT